MLRRVVIGGLLIAMLIGLLWLDERFTGAEVLWLPHHRLPAGFALFAACVLIILPLLALELSSLLGKINPRAPGFAWTLCVSLGAFVYACAGQFQWNFVAWVAGNVLLCALIPAFWAALGKNWSAALTGFGYWVLICVWIGWLPACWIQARSFLPAWSLACAVLVVKSADIGAYFTGLSLGRRRMAPWVSSLKTWEGLAGGIVLAATTAMALSGALGQSLNTCAAFGALAAFIGMLGDLSESILKREAGVKDSGVLVPGMGGVFDVMDSLLPTAPLALWLIA